MATSWGYLFGVTGSLPSLELRASNVTVGRDKSCSLVVSAGLLPGISGLHFSVSTSSAGSRLTAHSSATSVGDQKVAKNKTIPLPHGSKISIARRKAFVFLDKKTCDSSAHIPAVRDRYAFADSLGHGGFGDVFLAFEKRNPYNRFAVKVTTNSAKVLKFAQREADILKKLNHPCVIFTHEVFISSNKMYFVMELMEGGDLSNWVNSDKPLKERQSKLMFYQLALAVEYLHDQGITHRDLKPANILLKSNKPETLIKVTDFGLAKDEHIHSQLKTRAGTEHYFAPDILKPPPYTKQVDLWSMGVILFYSLTGALPFESRTEALNADFHVRYPPTRWQSVTFAALNIVKRMLVAQPELRATVQEVIAHEWLQDEGVRKQALDLQREVPGAVEPATAVVPAGAATGGVQRKKSFLDRLFRKR